MVSKLFHLNQFDSLNTEKVQYRKKRFYKIVERVQKNIWIKIAEYKFLGLGYHMM